MITQKDRTTLRELARQVVQVASLPIMEERRTLWKKHNSLQAVRPMILVFPEGSWTELLPESALLCEEEAACAAEWELRRRLYYHEHFRDDTVIEKEWIVGRSIRNSGWGLEPKWRPSSEARGARGFDPVLRDPADLKKIKRPQISFDEEQTQRTLAEAQDLFGDILDVKLKGVSHVSFHMMNYYTAVRGLGQVMLDMLDRPKMLHDAMAILEEGNRLLVQQYIDLNLLSLNNDSTYHSSGGVGYTGELPKPGFEPGRVRPRDLWASAESQELAQVSPKMHAEFVLPYEKRLLAPFSLNGYGCCEDLTRKLDDVLTIPQIRRISIAPWADVDACAAKLCGKAIFSWKPHPSHLVGDFSAEMLRRYIGHTIEAAKRHGCVLEMILKDTHTCEHRPERFTIWTQIARELLEKA